MSTSESILESTKKLLGIMEDYKIFDTDIIIHINTVFSNLAQMGVGEPEGFEIEDTNNTWSEFIPDNKKRLMNQVKTYMYLKVRTLFDPPASSVMMEALERNIKEIEYRLYTEWGGY